MRDFIMIFYACFAMIAPLRTIAVMCAVCGFKYIGWI